MIGKKSQKCVNKKNYEVCEWITLFIVSEKVCYAKVHIRIFIYQWVNLAKT